VNQLVLPALTGGAGSAFTDGWLTAGLTVTAGMMRRDSIEVDELRHPIRIVAQHIIPDTEGPGRFRGSPGAYAEYGPVDTSIDVMYQSDGNINPALGARGGGAGAPARQFKRDASGKVVEVPRVGLVTLGPGERICSMTCGGGGYGPPTERDPARVLHDVLEGSISRERAEQVYGVVLAGDEVDYAATTALRTRISAP
jgi:N-methylhydantoinase B